MIGVADNVTPIVFIAIQGSFSVEGDILIGGNNRAMITTISGTVLAGTFGRLQVFVDLVPIFGQQSASPDYLTTIGQFGTINVPVEPGQVIKGTIELDSSGYGGLIVAGYLYDAFSL